MVLLIAFVSRDTYMYKHRTATLNEARSKFNTAIGLLHTGENYPPMYQVQRNKESIDAAFHFGREMIRHGATHRDFGKHQWVGKALGVKSKSLSEWLFSRLF